MEKIIKWNKSSWGTKYLYYYIIWIIIKLEFIFSTFAAEENAWWIFWSTGSTWLTKENVRRWDIHIDDIPMIIRSTIDLLLEISWTIAIIFIIIWAYKILFGSLTSEKTKWKDTIIMALTWFAIATLAWFIIKFIIDNFSK